MSRRFPELATPRLLLRQANRRDVDAVLSIFSDEEVLRYYNVDLMTGRDQAYALIESRNRRYEVGYGIRWGIYVDGHRYIGSCGFELWHRAWRHAEIGYELGREHWGQGYMYEALTAIIRYGFQEMFLHRVEAQVDPENSRSKGVLAKLGFRAEGLARERGFWRGAYHDLVQFGLLQTEFSPAFLPGDEPKQV